MRISTINDKKLGKSFDFLKINYTWKKEKIPKVFNPIKYNYLILSLKF